MDWRMQGSAQRRRMNAPSNHFGAAMAGSTSPMDEALAGMARVGSPRVPMGTSAFIANVPSASPERGTLMPKKNTQAGDPAIMRAGTGTHTYASYNRNGAHYGIPVQFTATVDPAAGPTQANAKIVPSVAMRSAPNFSMGIESSMG